MAGTTETKVENFRLSMWEELGFDDDQALALLWARGTDGFYLSHHDVRKYLAGGATHDQIVHIFAPMA